MSMHARTKANGPARLSSLEVMRGLAALSVALAHAAETIRSHPLLPFQSPTVGFELPGLPGVVFFFALSGFVMMLRHADDVGQPGRVLPFLVRRISRIYPLYWLTLAATLYAVWPIPLKPIVVSSWITLWPFSWDSLVPVSWTLRMEMTFYLILALSILPRFGPMVFGVWLAASACAAMGVIAWPHTAPLSVLVNEYNIDFCMGLVTGLLWRRGPWSLRMAAVFGLGGWLIALIGLWRLDWGWTSHGPLSHVMMSGGVGGVMLACGTLERRRRLGRWAGVVGMASYPLYLCHLAVYDALTRPFGARGWAQALGPNVTLVVFTAMAVVMAVGIGLLDQELRRAARSRKKALLF
jgi:peptidoglycan/LPS O-acetylase OafA/YrhL